MAKFDDTAPPVVGRIHSTESFGAVDGPGIRYVLFLQGCPLRCLYCHNPDSCEIGSGKLTDSAQVAADIASYYNFIRRGGVTISGGEPLLQIEFVLDIIRRCHAKQLHVAIDTAGSVPVAVAAPVIDAADLLLLDIKALDDEVCRRLTGAGSARALAMLDYCESIGKPVWIRHVVVPGYTLDYAMLGDLARYIARFRCVEKVDLLPFHQMGEFKWKELGWEYRLENTPVPTPEEMARVRDIFRAENLTLT